MKLKRKLAPIWALLVASSFAHAASGNVFLRITAEPRGSDLAAMWVSGVMDSENVVLLNARDAVGSGAKPLIPPFCVPAEATAVQGAAILLKELRENPANNHLDVYVIARIALGRAWPCKGFE